MGVTAAGIGAVRASRSIIRSASAALLFDCLWHGCLRTGAGLLQDRAPERLLGRADVSSHRNHCRSRILVLDGSIDFVVFLECSAKTPWRARGGCYEQANLTTYQFSDPD